ncbi:MAG: helix-turn-helix domain-containing protein [Scytonematopsis contorta HA4267-MV1]|jgi:excisionase family DNA binding protein|nr:helix-turn-helix domain-containing protein [Scytonematopsis contorta HA4267-MV1]
MSKNLLITIDSQVNCSGDLKKKLEQNYQTGKHKLVGADGTELPISDDVFQVLKKIVPALEKRRTTVTISPTDAEMTTQQAADILNVSRPYLIKLLDNNEIPYVKTGSHRRIKVKDVMDYKEKRDTECRK